MTEFCQCCKLLKSKICNTCGKEKALDQYHSGKKICKDCRSGYNKEIYQNRKDQYKKELEEDLKNAEELIKIKKNKKTKKTPKHITT